MIEEKTHFMEMLDKWRAIQFFKIIIQPECRAGTAVPSKEVLELCAGTLLKAANLYHMVFPVVMYGCESWTLKKAELRRISAFKLWCWRRLLRVPWTARRSNQSIQKEINPEYSLEGLMLKLKLQYFGHLM